MIHKNNKNKYKIDDYIEWKKVYLNSNNDSLKEYKLLFYNKEHYKRVWPDWGRINKTLDQINTYGDAILHKNSKYWRIRKICKFILKGDIEIYDT